MRQFYTFLMSFFLSVFLGTAQNTPQTISMAGATNNTTAFGTEGTIATSVTTFYTHWDNTYIYVGWSEGRTNYSSDLYYVAFDVNPNSVSGCSNAIEGVEFQSGNALPDYYVVYENNDGFYGLPTTNGNAIEFYDGTSGNWNFVSRNSGNDGTNSRVDFQDGPNGEIRLRIAWNDLNFTPGDDKPIGITFWTNNESGNFMWSRFPNSNPSTGSTPKTMTHQIIFNSTGSGVSPSGSFYENALSDKLTYNSIGNTNWSDTNTWQNGGLPSTGSDVIISHDVTLDLDASINDISVENTHSLTINPTRSLTVTGNFTNNGTVTLNSNSQEYSSLIVEGTATGDVTYNRHTAQVGPTGTNDLVSSPVTGLEWGIFLSDNSGVLAENGTGTVYAFAPFDNENDYVNPSQYYVNYDNTTAVTTPLTSGQGYRAATENPNETLAYTGGVATGDIQANVDVGASTAFGQWNLIGNPYPSYLSTRSFLTNTNNQTLFGALNVALYGYDGDVSDGWDIRNLSNVPEEDTELMAPGQGFFVGVQSSGSMEFTSDMRRTGDGDDYILGRSTPLTYVILGLSSSTNSYSTSIYFNDASSLGLDIGYDAGLFGGTAPAFAIYSELVDNPQGVPIAIQSLNTLDLVGVTVPLGVNANQGEQITFSLNSNTLPVGTDVYLDDTVAGSSTLISAGDYTLTPTTSLNGLGRFFLRFENNALSISENDLDTLTIFADANKDIVISGTLTTTYTAQVYDLQGRIVLSHSLERNLSNQIIDANSLTRGIYIVELTNGGATKTEKIILR